ncbi:MAG: 3-keto-5-aminohexanoate cleavage protein [Gracilibacteraceae bacterium]|jgi:3-keto-5-aminohexanoate cleavage enzyme|nr:3-keto-5-aminohexanoate cleavage protein [Gracilibacteraceae bacterium]
MTEGIKDYLLGSYRETMDYVNKIARHGLTKMSPMIISCALSGGVHGKEANPNLPESAEEQAGAAYDAYNAGAVSVHIHARDPLHLYATTSKPRDFQEVNYLVRQKCPDVIINNTCMGGRQIFKEEKTVSDPIWPSIAARPELASMDITSLTHLNSTKDREAPLKCPRPAVDYHMDYLMTWDDCIETAREMRKNGIKPELEMFDMHNAKHIYNMISAGVLDKPYWVQMLFGGTGLYPTVEIMLQAARILPAETLFSIIGIGGSQNAMVTLGIILGHHIRVGMEDNPMYGPKQPAASNAQLVERVVRVARELGRPIATVAQAREMLGLGAPRRYDPV